MPITGIQFPQVNLPLAGNHGEINTTTDPHTNEAKPDQSVSPISFDSNSPRPKCIATG